MFLFLGRADHRYETMRTAFMNHVIHVTVVVVALAVYIWTGPLPKAWQRGLVADK